MILERGDMWDIFGKTDLFLITTNPVRRKDGAAVMGRGIALEAARRYPQLPYDFGKVLYNGEEDWVGTIGEYDNQMVGFFMVKEHWREMAQLDIISNSTHMLKIISRFYPENRYDLNFPGIGNGRLPRADVLRIIAQLPDNVHVWEYGND